MRLGFDAKRLFNNRTGLGNYSRTIVDNILKYNPEHELFLYSPSLELDNIKHKYEQESISISTANGHHDAHWRSFGIKKSIIEDNLDIYHGLSHELPRNNGSLDCKKIVTIHDLIYKKHPRYFPLIDRTIYDMKVKHAIKTSDTIIAISEHTKRDILDFFDVDDSKVKVIYQTISDQYWTGEMVTKPLPDLPSEYNLFVGSIEERKNVVRLLEAYAKIKKDLQIPLVLVGKGKSYLKIVKEKINELKLNDLVIIKQNISDETLKSVYKYANALFYPSLYEGFGLPVAEAIMCGIPVLTSNTSSLPEAGGDGAMYCDPYDEEDMIHKIEQISTDTALRNTLVDNGQRYIKSKFNPEKVTQELLEVYGG